MARRPDPMHAVAIEAAPDPFERAEARFAEIVTKLRSQEMGEMDLSDLEKKLAADGHKLMRDLVQGHLDLRSLGEVEGPVGGADGVERRDVHHRSRQVETLFGTVTVDRARFHATGHGGLAPLDGELNLPPERASLGVRRRVARLVTKMSFDDVAEELAETTGARVGKRQIEEMVEASAQDFDAFYEDRRARAEEARELVAPADGQDSLLILTMDGKGIPMRPDSLREQTRKAAEQAQPKLDKRRAKGERAHRKRMAAVAALYSVAPFVRTPEDIIKGLALKPGEVGPRRPAPVDKRVWASVAHPSEAVATELFAEALHRQAQQARRWVVLVDGNEAQLTNLLALGDLHGVKLTVIIDVIHVIEYLWRAGMAFEREGTKELEAWVRTRLQRVLEGGASDVATGLRRLSTRRKLGTKQRTPVDTCANYLDKYAEFLRYDAYLADGLPIATGVIEGACRYLVKDRMEKTGARWSTTGAEAVLRLRSLMASKDFDEYWVFHEAKELERNHIQHYAGGELPAIKPAKRALGKDRLRVVK